jgi:ribosome biogenesis GTPase / thiamine phosphate phosphatase
MPDAALRGLGLADEDATAFAAVAQPGDELARVARVDRGGWVTALTADGELRGRQHPRFRRLMDPLEIPTVGDWCVFRPDAGGGPTQLVQILPRRSAFVRTAGDAVESRTQLVAANVDVALVLVPCDGDRKLARIDRLLSLAFSSGAKPVLLLSKADACDDPDGVRAEVAAAVGDVVVLTLSAVTGEGFEALDALAVPGRTLVLVGTSGAGKSTLANRLAGSDVLATADVRADGRGRHTTTHRQLLLLPSGALLIDTPGLRSIGVWEADEEVDGPFADVEALLAACRFADCGHGTEPGCAVRAALEDGSLPAERWARYRTIEAERVERAQRREAIEKAAATRRGRAARAKGRQSRF